MRFFGITRGSAGTTIDAIAGSLSRLTLYWPISWRTLSAIVLGALLARWVWILFAPLATYTSAIPEYSTGIEAGQLFGEIASADSASVGVAIPNVQLLGVFTASPGRPGFAILKLDNKQAGVAQGEEVAPGTKLIEVDADHVLLERAGVQQRVDLENKYANSSGNKENMKPNGDASAATPQANIAAKELQNRLRQLHR
jgi:hypothetical protein